jgi:DNA-binding SARP family transcriptional activator
MNVLRIKLFGGGRVEFAETHPRVKLTSTTCFLLAYLVFYRQRAHPRDVLLNLMWGDLPSERARGCLNTALWRLRRHLEPQGIPTGTYLISTSTGEVSFNCQSDFWLDVAAFEQTVLDTLRHPPEQAVESQVAQLESAIDLYTGDLLESCYCDWVLPERERLRNLFLDAHYYLMGYYHTHQNFNRALQHGSVILAYNPLREDVHRQMMRLYNGSGQRSLAIQQYKICRQTLLDELDIEPMPETQALLEKITGSATGTASLSQAYNLNQGDVHLALARLQTALDTVNQARFELEQALSGLPDSR